MMRWCFGSSVYCRFLSAIWQKCPVLINSDTEMNTRHKHRPVRASALVIHTVANTHTHSANRLQQNKAWTGALTINIKETLLHLVVQTQSIWLYKRRSSQLLSGCDSLCIVLVLPPAGLNLWHSFHDTLTLNIWRCLEQVAARMKVCAAVWAWATRPSAPLTFKSADKHPHNKDTAVMSVSPAVKSFKQHVVPPPHTFYQCTGALRFLCLGLGRR